jgi:3-dehydrotetronate 4-kinase
VTPGSRLLLGAIADDLTGATDLASALALGGLRVAFSAGVPHAPSGPAEALIVALKIRSVGQAEAAAEAAAAAEYLERHGAQRLYFKYSSTFDSGETGNIGPVSDVLLERAGGGLAVVCPAFPRLRRTVYQGHLFVGEHLLDRSGLGDHPLTPRREASVVALMARQTAHAVGLVPLPTVRSGPAAIVGALTDLRDRGFRYAVTDATDDSDLVSLAAACVSHGFLTGSAGLAGALASLLRPLGRAQEAPAWRPPGSGPAVILSGSCSAVTRAQIKAFARHYPVLRLDPERLTAATVGEAAGWAAARLASSAVLICSLPADDGPPSSAPDAASKIEATLGWVARRLYDGGFRRFVVAGGETSGAVVQALGVGMLELGPELAPGVSWMSDDTPPGLLLALKSGNFGDEELFLRAANP